MNQILTLIRPSDEQPSRWVSAGTLSIILIVYFALRLPLAIANNGEVDEDWFTVPGWTVLQSGIPRIPYAPERDLAGVFYRGDDILFGMPPGFFYWEALFFWVFSPGYASGRLASMFAGAITIVMVYLLGKLLFKDARIALLGAAMYSIARVFYFPATIVRPDMLCAMFGAFSIFSILRWSEALEKRWLVAAGISCGLGLLTHPFAAVFCLQCGLWVLLRKRDDFHHRVVSATGFSVTTFLCLVPWGALILLDPDLFKIQFSNNVLHRTQEGLLHRFLFFYEPLKYHLEFLNYRTLWPQMLLMISGLVASTVIVLRSKNQSRVHIFFAWTSIYFLIALQGKHPTMGYWCYPSIFIFLAISHTAITVLQLIPKSYPGRFLQATCLVGLLLVMCLGSGIRVWWQTLNHWNDPAYNSRRMVAMLLDQLPADARYLVDRSYVFDFYLAGRDTLLGLNDRGFFEVKGQPYDYLVINPTESRPELATQLNAVLVQSFGDREHVAAEVYQHQRQVRTAP